MVCSPISEQFRKQVRNNEELSIVEFAMKYRASKARRPNQPFNYSALDAAIVAETAEKIVAGKKLTHFLETGLWTSIGAEGYANWGIDRAGTAIGPCCFRLRVGDLMRFGILVLDKGQDPRGYQVVPERGLISLRGTGRARTTFLAETHLTTQSVRSPIATSGGCFRSEQTSPRLGEGAVCPHLPTENTLIVQISDWRGENDELQCDTFRAHDELMRPLTRKNIGRF